MLLHETEHLRARDPLLLGAGSLALVLAPWVLPLWWMHRRLMLAVEVDCDARVLRHGVERRDYGAMLIDVAGRGSNLSAGAPAFSGTSTNLEKRLLAMTTSVRGISVKGASWGALGLTVIVTACATELPTSAEIEQMDVAAIENAAEQLTLIDPATDNLVYYLDGEQITAEQARAIPASGIAAVEVSLTTEVEGMRSVRLSSANAVDEGGDSGAAVPDDTGVRIVAGNAGPNEGLAISHVDDGEQLASGELEGIHVVGYGSNGLSAAAGSIRPAEGSAVVGQPEGAASTEPRAGDYNISYGVSGTGPPDLLFVIDGVRVDASAFGSLRPADIVSISVLKDASAAAYGFRAANGVILVTTRDGASQ
jgi:TonB-dependent SusC/RagA subfamily outer membrane receptor